MKAAPTTADTEVAQMIVDGILDTVERAGRFERAGKKSRALVFQCGIDLATGETFDVMDRMVKWVAAQITKRKENA